MHSDLKNMLINLNIQESQIIWEMHQESYKISKFIIIMQIILLIIQLFIQYIFKDIKINYNNLSLGNILGFVIAIFIWILLIILKFNLYINNKAWRDAKEKSNKLFE